MMKSGILLLDKQAGMTSFDCIRVLKKTWNRSDLGHGGTLDRFATGLLPVFVGDGLKLVRYFLESYPQLPTYWKSYAGVLTLGNKTETGDTEGAVIETKPVPENLSVERVQEAMNGFVRKQYLQNPPVYSAKKVNGERASDLARQGKPPELKPVSVVIEKFECTRIDGAKVYFEVKCSKGTYIRTLAEDLASRIGTAAHVTELRRTAVGNFNVSEAITLAQVEAVSQEQSIRGMDEATSFLPRFPLLRGEAQLISRGKVFEVVTRLANSGLEPGVYCGSEDVSGMLPKPAGLFQLKDQHRAEFIRGFKPELR